MGKPWATHGQGHATCPPHREPQEKALLTPAHSVGADDGIRTRDPHLGKKKVMDLVRKRGSTPLSRLRSVTLSAQPAESAPLRWSTLNALNLYQ